MGRAGAGGQHHHHHHAAPHGLEQLGGRTTADGADTAVWLASSPELDGVTGKFFEQRREVPCEFRDEEAEERLWQTCEHLVRPLVP